MTLTQLIPLLTAIAQTAPDAVVIDDDYRDILSVSLDSIDNKFVKLSVEKE